MKTKGSIADYGFQRDCELSDALKNAYKNLSNASADDIYRVVANSSSSRFWVSEKRASEVLSAMEKGKDINNMSPLRREMYKELFKRFSLFRRRNPNASKYDAAFYAVNSPAPKFYLTPKSAQVILYKFFNRIRKKK